jgi:hypothetical protein
LHTELWNTLNLIPEALNYIGLFGFEFGSAAAMAEIAGLLIYTEQYYL